MLSTSSCLLFCSQKMALHLLLLLLLAFQPFALGISNNIRQDSYLSAYMDIQSTTDQSVGVVYPEPMRTYGPPQPKPMVYYGPPSGPPTEYHHTSYAPMLDILMQLPSKLEFLPKLITAFLGVTKILLKVVLLKLVLKFVVMFCLFFFLPKLEMLDTATEMVTKPSMALTTNSTSAAPANGKIRRMDKEMILP